MMTMIRSAYLRVYVPETPMRDWERHIAAVPAVVTVADNFLWHEPLVNDAYTIEWRDSKYVCPRYPRLRMFEGMLAFRNAFPTIGHMMVPEAVMRSASGELELIRTRVPGARSHILASPWHVPLRWFLGFASEDREVQFGDGGPTILYRAQLGTARDRIERAAHILDEAGFDDSVLEPVQDLQRWLGDFRRDSLLELDYGDTVELFPEGQLVVDESCEEVNGSVDALERGDYEEAGNLYASVASRWAAAQALSYVN